jgi:hypothetical protein
MSELPGREWHLEVKRWDAAPRAAPMPRLEIGDVAKVMAMRCRPISQKSARPVGVSPLSAGAVRAIAALPLSLVAVLDQMFA